MDINSKEYWDSRFSTDWDMNSGREQTLYFCNLTLMNLPEWFHNILINGVTFADIGCAEGDCTNFLASAYTKSIFTGIDFSHNAILKAKNSFPEIEFIASDIMDITDRYDVVYSSNTLEHFHEPFKILDKLFEISNQYVVLLLPFQERERFKEHFYTFEYRDFKVQHDNFLLVYSREIDCSVVENMFWAGKQILLIYKRNLSSDNLSPTLEDYIGDLSSSVDKFKVREKSYESKINLIEKDLEYFKNILATSLEKSHTLLALLKDKEETTKELNRELNRQYDLIKQKSNHIDELKELISKQKMQLDAIDYYKRQEQWLLAENYKKETELNKIYHSGFWKFATKYYKLRELPGPRHLYKSLKIIKEHGFETFWGILGAKIKKNAKDRVNDRDSQLALTNLYKHINSLNNKNKLSGISIIQSAFPFDELYNQRTINLAKYLSSRNFGVLYISWQWNRKELSNQAFKEVFPNVFSIPMYTFIDNVEALNIFDETITDRFAFYNTPSLEYCNIIPDVRKSKFCIIYDIMDEWEQFSKVGQAPWYRKDCEELLVLQADSVITVSLPLKEKFMNLRSDIEVIGNGYFKNLLGNGDISNKKKGDKNYVHVGYFGHLTESWFDWDMIFEVLSDPDIQLHIIGYGASDNIIKKLKKYSNAKYYGKVKPQDLHKYVEKWHVGIIPFTNSKLSQAVDPIKIYEYLYFGLPTIVTGIDHLQKYPNVTVCENDPKLVIESIKKSYQRINTPNQNIELQEFLEYTSWDSRFDKMLDSVKKNDTFVRLYK